MVLQLGQVQLAKKVGVGGTAANGYSSGSLLAKGCMHGSAIVPAAQVSTKTHMHCTPALLCWFEVLGVDLTAQHQRIADCLSHHKWRALMLPCSDRMDLPVNVDALFQEWLPGQMRGHWAASYWDDDFRVFFTNKGSLFVLRREA